MGKVIIIIIIIIIIKPQTDHFSFFNFSLGFFRALSSTLGFWISSRLSVPM